MLFKDYIIQCENAKLEEAKMESLFLKGLMSAMLGIPLGMNINMPMDNINLGGIKQNTPIIYREPEKSSIPALPTIDNIPRKFRPSKPLKIKYDYISDTRGPTKKILSDQKDRSVPRIVQSTTNLIKEFEVFHSRAYDDGFGNITIGYGFTRDDMPYLDWGDTISEKESSVKLENILKDKYEPFINRNVKVDITQEQFDALMSWAYNVGIPSAKKSTLLKMVNRGHFELAAKEFPRWNKAKKNNRIIVVKGLTNRREKERKLFSSAIGIKIASAKR